MQMQIAIMRSKAPSMTAVVTRRVLSNIALHYLVGPQRNIDDDRETMTPREYITAK